MRLRAKRRGLSSHLARLLEQRAPHESEGGWRRSPSRELAQGNIRDIAKIGKEIFEWHTIDGKLAAVRTKYSDLQPDGSIQVFLRLE